MGEYSYKPDRISTANMGKIQHKPVSYHTLKLYTKDIDFANKHRAIQDKIYKLGVDRVQGRISKIVPNPGNPLQFGKESKDTKDDRDPKDWTLDDTDDPDELGMVHKKMSHFHGRRAMAHNRAAIRHVESCLYNENSESIDFTEAVSSVDSSILFPKESTDMLGVHAPNKCTALEAMEFHKRMHTEALKEQMEYHTLRSNMDKYIDAEPDPEKQKALHEAREVCNIQHGMYKEIGDLHCIEVAGYTDYLKRRADNDWGVDSPDVVQPSAPHVGGIFAPTSLQV